MKKEFVLGRLVQKLAECYPDVLMAVFDFTNMILVSKGDEERLLSEFKKFLRKEICQVFDIPKVETPVQGKIGKEIVLARLIQRLPFCKTELLVLLFDFAEKAQSKNFAVWVSEFREFQNGNPCWKWEWYIDGDKYPTLPYHESKTKVITHLKHGMLKWHPRLITLYRHSDKDRYMSYREFCTNLFENQKVANINVLNYLLKCSNRIPNEWGGKDHIHFLGTTFQGVTGHLKVHRLCCEKYSRNRYHWFEQVSYFEIGDDKWNESSYVAVLNI